MAQLSRAWSCHGPAALLLTCLVTGIAIAGCGSSATTTITSPAAVSKCSVVVAAPQGAVPATGGSGAITVTTARECAWTASSENPWLSIKSGASGQGDGSVQFEAVSNPDPVVRRGSILANNQRAEVTQAAGECTITLAQDSGNFDLTGGSGRVDVRVSSPLCTWTATPDADWIGIRSGATGTGAGTVSFEVAASAAPRAGAITVAGHRFTISQSRQVEGCSFTLNPTGYQTGSEGGTANVAVTATGASCAWTVSNSADWISVTAGAGSNTGSGTLSFTVAPTTGPGRSAALTIAGQSFTVTQGQGCTYGVSPDSASVPASGGTVPVTVTAGASCGWTATSNAPWIVVTSGSQGSGTGSVQLNVAATTGPNRSGTATIAGRTFTVNQGQGCTFAISPASTSIEAGGGQGSFEVQSESGCAWSATENAEWVTITAGSAGAGNGTVKFTAAANSGPARTATITAGGRTFTINQAGGCSYALSSSSANVPGEGGSGTVAVTAGSACAWTAASNADWITVTGGSRGTGNGTVSFTAAAHTGASRSGTLTIAGRTFTITQSESCTYTVSPMQQKVDNSGGNATVSVRTDGACRWTATSNVAWITVTAGATGTGDGNVQLTVAANTGSARTGTVTIAGRTVTIEQGAACSYSLAPASQTVPAAAGSGTVAVTAPGGCSWTAAATNTPWVTISSGASGSGNGTVQFAYEANSGAPRNGTLTIANQSFTLSQEGGCTFVVTPETIARGSAASTERVDVTAGSGCAWTAASNAPWLTISSGASGSGNGQVQAALGANTGPARSGTLTIATRTVTVTQESGCTYALSAPGFTAPTTGGAGSVNVSAGAGCPWTATSQAPWIVVVPPATPPSGDGTVAFNVDPNTTGAPRTGTILVGGQTFTVSQQ